MMTQKRLGILNATLRFSGMVFLCLLFGSWKIGFAGQANPVSFDPPSQAVTSESSPRDGSRFSSKPNLRLLGLGLFAIHGLVFEHWKKPTQTVEFRDRSLKTGISEGPVPAKEQEKLVSELKTLYETSERFLADTGGISKTQEPEKSKETKPEPLPSRVVPEDKSSSEDKGVYEKEQCEEIAHGWSCTAFYGGGGKKATVDKQHYYQGDTEKGSSWMSEHRMEWDREGKLIKDVLLRTQTEWQHDELKDYRYTQTYKNGVLIHEKYDEKLTDSARKNQDLLVKVGRI